MNKIITAAVFLLAGIIAIQAFPYNGYQTDYAHVPYYKFDWKVMDAKSYNDYGQYESRSGGNTRGNFWVDLPGKSYIKTDYNVDSRPVSTYTINRALSYY